MKKTAILLGGLLGILSFSTCSKNDCVCTTTTTENGVVTSSSSSTSAASGLGPATAVLDESSCSTGNYTDSYTSGSILYSNSTVCQLE